MRARNDQSISMDLCKNVLRAQCFRVGFIFLILLIISVKEHHSVYVPPDAEVKPLYPKGLRISVPDEAGISLVAFHVNFNQDFEGLEAGTIARDVVKVRNGRWTYEDRTTRLKKGDVIYYWVHVVYEGLGYNRLDQQHRVTGFYNYDGTLAEIPTTDDQSCASLSETWIVDNNGERRSACAGQLIFEDEFASLNTTTWKAIERFSGPPNYEFVVYRNSDENINVVNGRLRITPTFLDDKFGVGFTRLGGLTLEGCTGRAGTADCERVARGSYILPPVASGRLNTKESFKFLYGRIEIRAKLPRGDWIYPLLTLESIDNTGDIGKQYCEIRIGSSFGNAVLRSKEGNNLSGRILWAGGLLSAGQSMYFNRSDLPQRQSSFPWSDEYHIYELIWRNHHLTMKVDGIDYGEQELGAPFNSPFYLTLGLAVGGHSEFPDMSTSDGYAKPWRNIGSKALYDFYGSLDTWRRTWTQGTTTLEIDYVKVWAL